MAANLQQHLHKTDAPASEEQTPSDDNASNDSVSGTTNCPVCQTSVDAGAAKCSVCAFEF